MTKGRSKRFPASCAKNSAASKLAKRTLSAKDAARERLLWSSNQGARDSRWGTPEEIANLIVFAVSDAASYINGAELVADNAMDKS